MLTPGAYEHQQSLLTRLTVLRLGTFLAFLALAVSFWLLQVVQYDTYREMAENNRLRSLPQPAPRGIVFDREGRVLVRNRPSFTISIIREQSPDLDASFQRLSQYTGVEPARFQAMLEEHAYEPDFRPVPLLEHATEAQVAAVLAHRLEMPEMVVQQVPTRLYPADGVGAHLLGYVSEIRQGQMEQADFSGIGAGAMVGQAGLERHYNDLLMGQDGTREVVVNSRGREIEEYGYERPTEGQTLKLTVDLDLQRALEDAFDHLGYTGAAIVLNPQTGEVLALTSLPAFDPNDFATGMDRETFTALSNDPGRPFSNKLIQGSYMPGSTFKVAMAVAALGEGVIGLDHTEYCNGSVQIYGSTRRCNGQHGVVDLRTALERSCNVFFYKLGERLSIDVIYEYGVKLGLVGRSKIDLPGEIPSNVPNVAQREAVGQTWFPGDTISVAIGQGMLEITPIALARMVSTVANGGRLVTPYIVAETKDSEEGSEWEPIERPAPEQTLSMTPENLAAVREGLWRVVNGQRGTGVRARLAGRDIAGKTGSAQVISLTGLARARAAGSDRDLRDHAWFVFFAPSNDAQIAGVVFGEHAEHGSWVSPIAKHVVDTYFAKREGRPLPVLDPATAAARTTAAGEGGQR